MELGTTAVLISAWSTVAGLGIGLATLACIDTEGPDTQPVEPDARLSEQFSMLARGQVDLRERMTRAETILGELRTLTALQVPDGGVPVVRSQVQGGGDSGA